MKRLDRYLLWQFISALMKAFLALVGFYLLVDLLTHREAAIIRYHVEWGVILRYYAMSIPQVIERIAPLAMLVSALLVLGDAAQHNEVVSALAGGVSLRRFCLVPVAVALACAGAVFAMQETVGATAAREALRLEATYFPRRFVAQREGVSWANLSGGWTCHVHKFNRKALTGEGVLLHAVRPAGLEQIEARRIYWDDAQQAWLLEDGVWMKFGGGSAMDLERITLRSAPLADTPEDLFALSEDPETKTARELASAIRAATARGMPVAGEWTDFHAKFSQPAAVFVMIWLAIPFALRLRRGGLAISFGMSIFIAIAYLMLFGAAMVLGHAGRCPPALAAWLPNAAFLATGVVLTWRTPS